MGYVCPRCGGPVKRGSSGADVGVAFGAVGALLTAAFAGMKCDKCGPIPRSEFPPEVRSKMLMGSLVIVLIALALLAGLVVFLIAVS